MAEFVHLHNHTDYSILSGMMTTANLTDKVISLGMTACAITDRSNLFGVMEFYDYVCKINAGKIENKPAPDKPVKPIIGCEIFIEDSHNKSFEEDDKDFSEFVLLCENLTGYHNLLKLVSESYTKGLKNQPPRINLKMLKKYKDGLVVLSGGMNGALFKAFMNGGAVAAEKIIDQYTDLLDSDHFFIEVQNHGLKEELDFINYVKDVCPRKGLMPVATNNCYYVNRDDAQEHEVFLCIEKDAKITQEKGTGKGKRPFLPGTGYHVKSTGEMKKNFTQLPEAVTNAAILAQRLNVTFKEQEDPHWPVFQIPDGYTQETYLKKIAYDGLKAKIPDYDKTYTDRLDYELSVINEMGFPAYFLIVSDFINAAKKEMLVGPGRGSGAGSLVAYVTGITNLDPIEYGLLFERFLNPERVNLPDIDIDFQDNKREWVVEYCKKKYGKEKISQIITYGKLKAKAVFKDVARVYGVEFEESNKVSAHINEKENLKFSYKNNEVFKDKIDSSAVYQKIYRSALKFENLTRQTGIHAAGVIIADKSVENYAPLYSDGEQICTQYDHNTLEAKCGLIKMDFLGLKTLSIIDNTLKLIEKHHKKNIDIDKIPLDDKKSYILFAQGNTSGIFQLESPGMKKWLKQLKPGTIKELRAMTAMYRPGPMAWIPAYIAKKFSKEPDFQNDTEKAENFKKLKEFCNKSKVINEILEPTNLIPIYQEQIIQFGQKIAGFSLGKADLMRRAMGKKKKAVLDAMKKDFVAGAVKNNLTKEDGEFLFEKIIIPFSKYGFNKSHAACYAYIAYQTAWLKVHYPECFMTALLNSRIEKTDDIKKYIDECKAMGLKIIPPDINESDLYFKVKDGKILYGLAAIKRVGFSVGEEILAKRHEKGRFSSFYDFLENFSENRLNKQPIEALIKAGAFDHFHVSAEHLFNLYPDFQEFLDKEQKIKAGGQTTFFEQTEAAVVKDDENPENVLKHYENRESDLQTLKKYENEVLGFNLKHDPTAKYAREIRAVSTHDFQTKETWKNKEKITIVGAVSNIKEIINRKGAPMAFLSLYGPGGTAEVVVFSDLYCALKNIKNPTEGNHNYYRRINGPRKLPSPDPGIFEKENLIYCEGEVNWRNGEISVKAETLRRFDPLKLPLRYLKSLHIEFKNPAVSENDFSTLRKTLHHFYGDGVNVFLHFKRDDGKMKTVKAGNAVRVIADDHLKASLKKLPFITKFWFEVLN